MTNIEINAKTKNKLETIGKILSPYLDINYDDFDEIIDILIDNFNNHKLKAEYDKKENIIKIGYQNSKIYSMPILIFELKKGCYEKIGIWMQKITLFQKSTQMLWNISKNVRIHFYN